MIASLLLQTGPGGTHGVGHGTGAPLWSPLVMLLVVAVLVVIVLLAVRQSGTDSRPPDSELAILRRQYARGEIDEETFEHRRRRLDESRS